jgi:hypothetical protein
MSLPSGAKFLRISTILKTKSKNQNQVMSRMSERGSVAEFPKVPRSREKLLAKVRANVMT